MSHVFSQTSGLVCSVLHQRPLSAFSDFPNKLFLTLTRVDV